MSIEDNMKQITDLASQLVKEESSAINPILPKDNLFVNKGWQCPICGRVYSPTTPMCFYCGRKDIQNIDSYDKNELEQITKWLEANANSSKFRNVYEMLERFKLHFTFKEKKLFPLNKKTMPDSSQAGHRPI